VRRDIIIVSEPVDDTSMTATIEYEGAHVEMTITGDMPLARRLLDTLRDPNLPLARWLEAVEECQRAHRDMDALRARLERETTLLTCPECGRGGQPAQARRRWWLSRWLSRWRWWRGRYHHCIRAGRR